MRSTARVTIRLACAECDRSDFDGITLRQLREAIKSGWKEVQRVQTYRQACTIFSSTEDAPRGHSRFEWWTHLGWCPDCAEEDD